MSPTIGQILIRIDLFKSISSGLLLRLKGSLSGRHVVSPFEGLLEFVVRWPPIFEFKNIFMIMLSSHAVQFIPQSSTNSISGERFNFPIIFMLNIDNTGRRGEECGLTISVIFCVEGESVKFSLYVVPHNCNLSQTSIERFSCWHVNVISQSEDIVVFFVLECVRVHIEKSSTIS